MRLALLTVLASLVSGTAAANCTGTPLFCDDFESGDLSHWLNVTNFTNSAPPIPGPEGPLAVRLDYAAGSDDAGWMWKKGLRQDSAARDKQFLRWRQFWPQDFEWFSGTSGDQKIFMLFGLSPQDGWAQSADWKVYLHLVGNVHSSSNVAPNELYVAMNHNSGGTTVWRSMKQNMTVKRYQKNTWHCTEAEILVNTPGQPDGELRIWIDDTLVMEYRDVVYRESAISWNAIMMSGWYAGGSPKNQSAYVDDVVVSPQRIGCSSTVSSAPLPPSNLTVVN